MKGAERQTPRSGTEFSQIQNRQFWRQRVRFLSE